VAGFRYSAKSTSDSRLLVGDVAEDDNRLGDGLAIFRVMDMNQTPAPSFFALDQGFRRRASLRLICLFALSRETPSGIQTKRHHRRRELTRHLFQRVTKIKGLGLMKPNKTQ
jgi:hypothetical protein